jgi:methionyl-tRNA synthetase
MPENHDSDWDWAEFVAKNNGELVATWGNLANRVLSFCYKHWDGHIPSFENGEQPGVPPLRQADQDMLAEIEAGFVTVGNLLDAVKLRSALQEAFRLASRVNQYLDQMAPWQMIKTDKESTALTIYSALKAIDSLKILFAPFLPFTCERLHGFLGYQSSLFGQVSTSIVKDSLGEHKVLLYDGRAGLQWKPSELAPGTKLTPPAPLFKKLEEKVVEEERARLGNAALQNNG